MISEFTNRRDPLNGFTLQEAKAKKDEVDKIHEVSLPGSKWNPARIVMDPLKKSGYKVVISTIN